MPDVNPNCLYKLAPDFSWMIVRRGQESRRVEKLAREERGFNEYWKYFQELRRAGIKPTRAHVADRIFRRTGVKRGFVYGNFHTRALRLAKESSVRQLDRSFQEMHPAKKSGQIKNNQFVSLTTSIGGLYTYPGMPGKP
jgi:hypothetical protein